MQSKHVNQPMLAYVQLISAGLAAAMWYIWPNAGVWPLLLGLTPWLVRLIITGRVAATRTPFDMPLTLFIVTGAVAVWSAFDRETAVAKFWLIVAAVLLFYAFVNWIQILMFQPGTQVEQPAWLLALFGMAVTFYFLATHNWDDFPTKVALFKQIGLALQRPLPSLPGHRLHPNVVGGILAMLLPFGIISASLARRRSHVAAMALGLFTSGIMLLGLLLSSSRGAWLALLTAIIFAFSWWLAGKLSFNLRKDNRRYQRWIWLGILFGVGLIGTILWIALPNVTAQIVQTLHLLLGGQDRLDLYRNSMILVQDYPLVGSGLGNFMMLYSTYAYLIHVGFIIHAHNIYLDVAIEQSLIGLLALLWMWAIFASLWWRTAGQDKKIPPLFGAASLSLITILVHGLVEDALYGSRALLLLFIPLAFVMYLPLKVLAKSTSLRRQSLVFAGIVPVMLIMGLFPSMRSYIFSNWAAVQQSKAELAVYQWPDWPIQDAVRRDLNQNAAIANFEKALTLNTTNPTANRRLGMINLSMGAHAQALAHFAAAYEQNPWDNATRQLYGEALILNGRNQEGAQLWSMVVNKEGQLDNRVFWYKHIGNATQSQIFNNVIIENAQ